jgi:hypothetical protein
MNQNISFELSTEEKKALANNKNTKVNVSSGHRLQTGVRAGPIVVDDEGCIFYARNAPFAPEHV